MDTGKRVSLISTFTLFLLAILKYSVGLLSGSVALMADAIHHFTDTMASLAVYLGLRISEKEPTEEFPYGFYKIENIISLFLSLLIFLAAYEIVKESLSGFGERPLENLSMAISVTLLSIVAVGVLSRYKIKVGKATGSPSLIADGRHTQADVYSSLAVLLGLMGFYAGISFADQAAGILVSAFIIRAGYEILVDSLKVLLDASLSYDVLDSIKGIARGFSGVQDVKSVKARSSGKFVFVEMELETRLRDLKKAHEMSLRIEEEIKKRVKNVDRVLIKVLPIKKEFIRFAVPLEENQDINSKISKHFGKAPYFCIFDLRAGKLENMKFLQNPYTRMGKKKGMETAKFLVKEGIDVLAVKETLEGKGPAYVLEDSYVEIRPMECETLKEAVETLK
jgi:cation diffusion facilitator family transporter